MKFDEIVLETPLFTDEAGAVELTTRVPSSATIGKHNLTLLYIDFYREYDKVKYIIYAPTTKIIAYAEFEVTSGVATTRDIEALRASLEDLKKILIALNENVTKLVSDISALRENLTAYINNEILRINNRVSDLTNELLRINNTVSTLNIAMQQLSLKAADLDNALKSLEAQLSKVRDELKELATIVSTINATLSKKIASDVERLEEQISSLNVKLKEARDLLESLKVELSSRISEVRSELYNKTQEQASIVEGLREEQVTTKLISIVAIAMALVAIGLGVFRARALKPGRS